MIEGSIAGYNALGAVECKFFNKKVDVKVVDSFIGFLQDVNATFGIIITNEGYTKGAINRAEYDKIKLDIVNFEELDEYHYEPDLCQICDHPYPVVDFYKTQDYFDKDNQKHTVTIGACEQCNSYHLKCDCGTINEFYEGDYEEWKECSGGCGLFFNVSYLYDSSHMLYEELEISDNIVDDED